MPLRFSFKAPGTSFACDVQCQRCTARTATGARCTNRTCIGVPKCWQHLLRDSNLRIKKSTIRGAGSGLFAMKRRAPGEVLFRAGEVIAPYGGERMRKVTVDRRYGEYTAPYAIKLSPDRFENGACIRGVGAVANHAPSGIANAEFVTFPGSVAKLVALTDIVNGQEILVNYGGDYLMGEAGVSGVTSRRRAPRARPAP